MSEEKKKGCFTLPGEAGYEKLTLEMAEKWVADVIRDSDGTVLSDEILDAGLWNLFHHLHHPRPTMNGRRKIRTSGSSAS